MDAPSAQAWQDFTFSAADGLLLAGRHYRAVDHRGIAHAAPVVCLPGLSRNARDFHEFALFQTREAEVNRDVYAFDYRGRGRSAYDSDWTRYNPLQEAEDVVVGLTALDIGTAHFIGTSRGGLIIQILSALRAGAIASVVLNDVGPQIAGAGLVRIKKVLEGSHYASDIDEAARRLRLAYERDFPGRSDADWLREAKRIFVDVTDEKEQRKGLVKRDFDPALVKTLEALDLDTPLPSLWPQFDGLRKKPMLVIRGENSDLLDTAVVGKMSARHEGMVQVVAKGEGHAPDVGGVALATTIAEFFAGNEPANMHPPAVAIGGGPR